MRKRSLPTIQVSLPFQTENSGLSGAAPISEPSKYTAQIRSLTPEPRTATSQSNPLAQPRPAWRGDRGRTAPPTQSHRALQTGARSPSAARSSRLAPTRLERPPNRNARLRPVGHTHSGRSRSFHFDQSEPETPLGQSRASNPRREGTSASLGAGPRARAAIATPAHRADILVDLSGFSRRLRSLAWVGGWAGAAPSYSLGNLSGGRLCRHTFVGGPGESE